MNDIIDSLRSKWACAAFVGQSPAFVEAIHQLPCIARDRAAVLIEGETGVGKELAARALHYLGPRAGFPFVAVNCGALPDTLLEGELFGHERGAFTDAQGRREGLIAQADKDTLFLDEIDSLSRKAQVSLLRVLQEGRYRPIGSSKEQCADVRVVTATNSPLEELVKTGAFRADLYYRVSVFRVHIPPLRQRPEDIPLLAAHFLEKHASEDEPAPVLSPKALAVLVVYDWPGNVRELENVMIRARRLCRNGLIEVEELGLRPAPFASGGINTFQVMKQGAVRDFERNYLRRLMAAHQGNVTRAARTAGNDRRELGKLLKKHHIDPRVFMAPAIRG